MTKQRFPRSAGTLLITGLILTGCTGRPVARLTAQTTSQVAATAPAKTVSSGPFAERVAVGGGALKLTATPLKLGPAQFTVEAEGGLVPYEIQGFMAEMGHGWNHELTPEGDRWTTHLHWEMDGRWLVRVKARDGDGQEQVGLFYLKVAP
jgi:hypothetical protein